MLKRHTVHVETNVPIPMRDGTSLYADIYRPSGHGRYPVLLQRTPYDKNYHRTAPLDMVRAAEQGYATVVQDVRGRFSSNGHFYPFSHESNDGYDTIEWIAAQPWSIGKVGMYGGSYVGATQWLAALAKPPHLTAIAPTITASSYYDGWTYQGGALQLGFVLSWSLNFLTYENLENLASINPEVRHQEEELIRVVDNMQEAFRYLPLKELPYLKLGEVADYYYDWLAHPENDAYWRQWSIEDRHSELSIPSLNIGGWYDIFVGGTVRNFTGMRAKAQSDAERNAHKLVIGPWIHETPFTQFIGAYNSGVLTAAEHFDMDGLHLRWYDHWLKGADNGLLDEPPVRIFVMGENRWRNEQDWPLARARDTRFFLHSGGHANTRNGDGILSIKGPTDEPADQFVYSPSDPVTTNGGCLCCDSAALPEGAFDQQEIEQREDVLVYSTEPLAQPLEVTGPVKMTLWAASTARDTDFTAKLVDVHPNGAAYNIADGIIRARYRESRTQAKLLTPGQVYQYEINLGPTSMLFKEGHRIRLEIASSNFPRFDRNPNTGAPFGASAQMQPARQTVLHSAQYPSHITLPLVPRE